MALVVASFVTLLGMEKGCLSPEANNDPAWEFVRE
jgi:hypothetical protein